MKKNLRKQYEAYLNSSNTELSHVYKTWSAEKEKAYNYCLNKCRKMNGEDFRVISANTFQFSVGWTYEDPETGALMFNVETANNSYQDYI